MEREHKYNPDSGRCVCGGQVVYFEDPDEAGRYGEGCEVASLTWESIKLANIPSKCAICGEPLSGEVAEMYDAAMVGMHGEAAGDEGYAGIVHTQCGLSKGWEVA